VSGGEPILLRRLKRTTIASPSQWEGETLDGKEVYVRYRHGLLSVEVDEQQVLECSALEAHGCLMEENELQEYWPFKVVG
jgi:hypothetical protein